MDRRPPYVSQSVHFRRRGSIECRAALVVRICGDGVVNLCLLLDEQHEGVEFRSAVFFEHYAVVSREPAVDDSWHYPCDKVE